MDRRKGEYAREMPRRDRGGEAAEDMSESIVIDSLSSLAQLRRMSMSELPPLFSLPRMDVLDVPPSMQPRPWVKLHNLLIARAPPIVLHLVQNPFGPSTPNPPSSRSRANARLSSPSSPGSTPP